MAQRLIRFFQDGSFEFTDLTDVDILNPANNEIVIYNNGAWTNADISTFRDFIQNVDVLENTNTVNTNTTYVVDVSNGPVTAYLPPNPKIGDFIRFVDQFSLNNGPIGFGTNSFTMQPSPGFIIEDDVSLVLTTDGAQAELVYLGNNAWKDISGLTTPILYLDDLLDVDAVPVDNGLDRYLRFNNETLRWESRVIDFVESVNNYTGDVLLTANDIPETSLRFYFNQAKFLIECNRTDLDEMQDVIYDQPIFDGNVLTWDTVQGAWVPRSPGLGLDLDDLSDVVVDYDSATPFWAVERGHGSEFYIVEYNETTMQNENVPTGIFDWDETYLLAWINNDNRWRTYSFGQEIMGRTRLTQLQDVQIPEFFYRIDVNHGQALMWDANIKRWTPGGYVDLRDSDDLDMGGINLYCRPDTLPGVANQSLEIGHLENVSDTLINMNPISHPSAGVLSWDPLSSEWNIIGSLTENATTANIPESLAASNQVVTPVNSTDPNDRAYYTQTRHLVNMRTITPLTEHQDVRDPIGRTDGMVLTWNGVTSYWEPSNVAVGIFNTEHLPEGPSPSRLTAKYYSDDRVADYLSGGGLPQTTSTEPDKLNLMGDVNYDYANIETGESLVWDPTERGGLGAWVNGYPIPLPIMDRGDLLVGIGTTNFDYSALPVGEDGQYLRCDFSQQNLIAWADKEPASKFKIQFPDIVRNEFTRAQDLTDTFIFLGTNEGTDPVEDYVNQAGILFNWYLESNGIPISHLTDRTYYNSFFDISVEPNINTNTAAFTEMFANGNLVVDFLAANVYRPEQIAMQIRTTGNFRFKVDVSDDAIVWDPLQVENPDTQVGGFIDFEFEISVTQTADNDGIGLNSVTLVNDPSLEDRFYYLVTLPLYNQEFQTGASINDSFYRYVRIRPDSIVQAGVCELYEVALYGWFNNGIQFHRMLGTDGDYYLTSGVNALEYVLPGTTFDVNEAGIYVGFQATIIADNGHTNYVYTNNQGRIYNNTAVGNTPDVNNPITIPPKAMAIVTYGGLSFDSVAQESFHRWHLNLIGAGGGGGGGSAFYLDRANHIGTQDVSTITGLHPVATSGLYSDITGRPSLATVASSGNYTDLNNRPTLGTAADKDAGTLAGQVLLLSANNQLPALDGSLLTNIGGTGTFNSPATTLGDLIVHDGTEEVRFGVGANGFVLIADDTQPQGVRWGSVTGAGTDAATLNGELPAYYLNRGNHTGTQPVASIVGLHPVATSGNYNDLSNLPTLGTASALNAGTLNGQVLLLSADNQLPALDGSLLTGVGTPTVAKGDLIVRSAVQDARLGVGTDGQILAADSAEALGVKWVTPGAVSDAGTLNGEAGSYYLDLTNHTGQLDANTDITNLADVATSGDYNDLINAPLVNLATVATTGEYVDLLNKPTLGTSSQFNVGTGPFNVVQLDSQGNLPAGLTQSFSLPINTKGDILIHDDTEIVRFPAGVDNYVLISDSNQTEGLRWVDLASLGVAPTLPTSLKGDIIVHDGTTNIALGKGLQGYLLSVDNGEPSGLKWVDGTVLGGSPLTTRGDLYTYANGVGNTRLGVGSNNQVLVADDTQPTGLKWADIIANSGNADTLNNESPAFYLDRTNHTGFQSLSTISDAGTAASRAAGTLANQVLLLSVDNQLPALDGSLLTNLPGSSDADTLDGQQGTFYLDRTNHTGTQTLATISDSGSAAALDAGTLTGQVLLLAEDNKLPALDGSLLTNVSAAPVVTQISAASVTLAQAKIRIVLLNSTSNEIQITMPASPQDEDQVIFVDEIGSDPNSPTGLGNNKAVINANTSQDIQGYSDIDLDVENSTLHLIYRSNRWSIVNATF